MHYKRTSRAFSPTLTALTVKMKSTAGYASVNSTCAQPLPPPGNCGAFARLVSPGGGAFANVALPGDQVFANPRANPELLTGTRFPIRI